MVGNYFTKSLEEFQGKLQNFMPAYFGKIGKVVMKETDGMEVLLPLAYQQLAEDLTDDFVNDLHLHVLFAKKSYDDKIYRIVLYSTPYEHEMVVIQMDSLQHGILEEIRVSFFDSLEKMYSHARQLWYESLFMKGKLLEGIEQEAELMQDFF